MKFGRWLTSESQNSALSMSICRHALEVAERTLVRRHLKEYLSERLSAFCVGTSGTGQRPRQQNAENCCLQTSDEPLLIAALSES